MARCLVIGAALGALAGCGGSALTPGEGFVDVEGGRVWYRIEAEALGTPVLLLHGGPGAPSYYLEPLEALAADRPVIFYDQLGAGRSDKPDDPSLWRVDRFVDELAAVREALGLDEVHIYGHSWGTMLAVEYMLTEPEGVKSLILASPAINVRRWMDDAKRLIAQMPGDVQVAIARHERAGTTDSAQYQEAVMEYYRRHVSRSDPWSPDLLAAFENLNEDIYVRMWGPSEFAATGSLAGFDREDALPQLDLPVLYTAGRYDKATPETVEHYRSLTPGAEIAIFERSAHMTMLDEPEAYVAALREFLAKVDAMDR